MSETIAVRIRRLIASGALSDGEWLPTEPALMAEFGVSRPTLREAFRLLEADSLIRIRRGPPGGAQVQLPGPGAVAPVFGMLLTLSGATLRDVYDARLVLEPPAARRLAEHGSPADHSMLAEELELARLAANAPETFGPTTVRFHQRMVELSGNRTLAAVVGMLGEVMTRHVAHVYRETRTPRAELSRRHRHVLRTYGQLVRLVTERRGEDAQELWLRHMRAAATYLLGDHGAETQVVELPE